MRFDISDRIHASFRIEDIKGSDGPPDDEEDHMNNLSETSLDMNGHLLNQSTRSIDIDNLSAYSSVGADSPLMARQTSTSSFMDSCDAFGGASHHNMASFAASRAKDRFHESLSLSTFSNTLHKDYENRECVAPFDIKEIVLGKRLGSGEFSHVYKVKCFRLANSPLGSSLNDRETYLRKYVKGREKYRATKKSRYALKHLKPELTEKYSPSEYAQFAADIAQEKEFLSILQHPNIIKLRGTSFDSSTDSFQQGSRGYFLIIDRLDETLDHRIAKWKRGNNKRGSIFSIIRKDTGGITDKRNNLLSEQLDVLLQLAAAFVYLHEKKIIFRDLKPANVGFDVRGDVKLFDFGLAKIMPPNGDPYTDSYEMSCAGTPRYMAPEVLGSDPMYNLKADIYTFSIVMWEVLALMKPFAFVRGKSQLIDYIGKV